jgi:hypothetical protein
MSSPAEAITIEEMQEVRERAAALRDRRDKEAAEEIAREAAEKAPPTVAERKAKALVEKEKARAKREAELDERAELYQPIIDSVNSFHLLTQQSKPRLKPPKVGSILRNPWRSLPHRAWILMHRLVLVDHYEEVHGTKLKYICHYPQGMALTDAGEILVANPLHGDNPGFLLEPPSPSNFSWHTLTRENIHFLGSPGNLEVVAENIMKFVESS